MKQVYRTPKKGWAVRSWDFIPAGAPVCEYIGVLRRTEDLDNACDNENSFIFDIDCLQTMRGLGGREVLLEFFSAYFIFFSFLCNSITFIVKWFSNQVCQF